MTKLYKGDIVQKTIDSRGNPLDWLWGTDLMGVNKNVDIGNSHVLWHRPFKNHVKHTWWILVLRWYRPLRERFQKRFNRIIRKLFG